MTIDRKLINRAYLSRHDFEECNKFLDGFIERNKDTIKEALLISALVAYARPFSENKEHPKIINKIPLEKVTKPLGPEERKLHNKLMTIRNQAIAHSVFDKKPTGSIIQGVALVQQSKPYNILAESIDIKEMKDLSEKMITICDDIICNEQRKLEL
jgi:endonuclease III-like uncharacterized protein